MVVKYQILLIFQSNKQIIMEIEGRITTVLNKRTGKSPRTGYPWVSQDFVMELSGERPFRCMFNVYGEDRIKAYNILSGGHYQVKFDIVARLHRNTWINHFRAYSVVNTKMVERYKEDHNWLVREYEYANSLTKLPPSPTPPPPCPEKRVESSFFEEVGRIIEKNEIKRGISALTYKPWVSQEYIMMTNGIQPRFLSFQVKDENLINELNIQQDEELAVRFVINAIECNGIWFNDICVVGVNRDIQPTNLKYYHKIIEVYGRNR